MLKMGMMPYVAKTPLYSEVLIDPTERVEAQVVEDNWDNWVFELEAEPDFEGDAGLNQFFHGGNPRALVGGVTVGTQSVFVTQRHGRPGRTAVFFGGLKSFTGTHCEKHSDWPSDGRSCGGHNKGVVDLVVVMIINDDRQLVGRFFSAHGCSSP